MISGNPGGVNPARARNCLTAGNLVFFPGSRECLMLTDGGQIVIGAGLLMR
jgi:hypothetical protein